MKIHMQYIPELEFYQMIPLCSATSPQQTTTDPSKVTCKKCLKIIEREKGK